MSLNILLSSFCWFFFSLIDMAYQVRIDIVLQKSGMCVRVGNFCFKQCVINIILTRDSVNFTSHSSVVSGSSAHIHVNFKGCSSKQCSNLVTHHNLSSQNFQFESRFQLSKCQSEPYIAPSGPVSTQQPPIGVRVYA